ncbi:putative membrane protein [Paenibacillus castaneae]|uniref:CcdC protein domain-containing protein n=1 Tax=Paenibacillus castaneae TaxID=474957 RepID=UPI000C9ADDF1|nr:CcdC protein domain-containing protein [Paenibacillus castaneae]NIK79160.1 putative membrane protein [Paenibacillus castaneae]
MTQQQWDLIGYAVWALIIWVTIKQFRQTRKDVTGSGLRLLFGDWLMFLALPWIAYCMGSRATLEQLFWTLGLGAILAVPYMVTTKFEKRADGGIRFKFNPLFYVFLLGFPYARYLIRDYVFHKYPILTEAYRPDIELMLAEYISVLILYTLVWRLYMYASYRRALRTSSQSAAVSQTGMDQASSIHD